LDVLSIWAALSPNMLLFAAACALIAGICRGFAGFGLSALIVTSLTLVLLPLEVVPVTLLLEMGASIFMARITWNEIHWPLLWRLLAGAAIGIPVGVLILKYVPPDPVRIIISLLVLTASIALFLGKKIILQETSLKNFSMGIISGVANGIASLGGLPVVIYMMAIALSATAVRATLNLYFFVICGYGTGTLWFADLLKQTTFIRAVILLPFVLLGIWLGNTIFKRSSALHYRYFVLSLLTALACLGLFKTAF